jgi:hypothetical protein
MLAFDPESGIELDQTSMQQIIFNNDPITLSRAFLYFIGTGREVSDLNVHTQRELILAFMPGDKHKLDKKRILKLFQKVNDKRKLKITNIDATKQNLTLSDVYDLLDLVLVLLFAFDPKERHIVDLPNVHQLISRLEPHELVHFVLMQRT